MPMTRREFLRVVGMAGAGLAAGRLGVSAASRRPNVLLVMTDQQPLGGVHAFGNSLIRTPALDDLARRGCLFGHSYIAGFPCSPSRASLMTGRYPHHHGVERNDVALAPQMPCLGDLFRAAGYQTAYFGKWHLGGNMYRGRPDRRGRGLDGNWVYQRIPDDTDFRFQAVRGGLGEDASQHGFTTWEGGWEQYHQYLRRVGLGQFADRGVGCHNDAPSGPEGTHIYSQLPPEHHMAAFFAGQAEAFIRRQASAAQPWCAVLSFFGPHLPVAPPRPWDEMYGLKQVHLPANHFDKLEGKPVRQRANHTCYVLPRWRDEQFLDYIRRYWGYCSYLDSQMTRAFTALTETHQWDDTIVMFTSDHGDMVSAHGMIYKLGDCGYEELYHVPALLHIPGVTRPGSRQDDLVSHIDWLPTILDACGLSAPPDLDGQSILPRLQDRSQQPRTNVVADCSDSSLVTRDQRYKFVLNWKNRDMDELYDLQTDPGEMHNLAYVSAGSALAATMRRGLLNWTRRAGHPYAATIAAQAAKQPETKVLEIAAAGEKFRYLGGNEFELGIVWHVDKDVKASGKYWAFTQFLNPKYAADGQIVFRFTPWPDPPVTDWKAGHDYHVGPVKVKVPDRAGPGEYEVRTGFYDPTTHKGPGVILDGQGNAMVIGALIITKPGDHITRIIFKPAQP